MKLLTSKKYLTILSLVVIALILVTQYQNCGSHQNGSGLAISTSSSSGTSAVLVTLLSTGTSGITGSVFRFTANASGGTAPYNYLWNTGGLSAACLNTSPICDITFNSPGNFSISVGVSDTSKASALSSAISVAITSVVQPIVATLSSSAATGNPGSSFTFNVSTTGGTGSFKYVWTLGSGSGNCPITSNQCVVTFGSTGTFNVGVTVVDATQANLSSSVSSTVTIVGLPLVLNLSPPSATVSINTPLTFVATVSGGQPPYTYTWTTPGSALTCPSANSCSVNYPGINLWNSVQLSVKDSGGSTITGTSAVAVTY